MEALVLQKLDRLRLGFAEMRSALVTFSGGVDSTFLAKVARETLGEKAVAFTAHSASLPRAELEEAKQLAAQIGIEHVILESKELDDPRYAANPMNRCYFCKSELFSIARRYADERGIGCVVDGTHVDDLKDVRPGRQAAKEWQVRSPLVEASFTKEEIRQASRMLGLPTWDKPAMACLASRLPTGTVVTVGRLSQVELCERALKELGFNEVRARHLKESVRLELDSEAIARLADDALRARVTDACGRAGFGRVLVDLAGRAAG